MKYNINDEFIHREYKLKIKEIDLVKKLYICDVYRYNNITNSIDHTDNTLDILCARHNWTYQQVSPNANINLPSGFKVEIPAIYNDCNHLNVQEKILFTSTYKVCQDCKKEL